MQLEMTAGSRNVDFEPQMQEGLDSVVNAHISLTFPTAVFYSHPQKLFLGESVVNLDAQIRGGDLSVRSVQVFIAKWIGR